MRISDPVIVFDIETDGLLDEVTTLHSLVMADPDSGEMWSCCDHPHYRSPTGAVVLSLSEGLERLHKATSAGACIAGHNIICYDLPALAKLRGAEFRFARIRDTLTLSRLLYPEIKDQDWKLVRSGKAKPGPWMGSHSLGSWGVRLGNHKGEYGQREDAWAAWSPDMQSYCEQDVRVTCALWRLLASKHPDARSVELEHEFQRVLFQQEQTGFPFDEEAAHALHARLVGERLRLEEEFSRLFPPWWRQGKEFTPTADNRRHHYVAGAALTRISLEPFNPGSRQDIADRLIKLRGWKPDEFTDTGEPKVDESVLRKLPWLECGKLADYLMVQKRLGQLAEGDKAWLKLVRPDGRIHGRVITNGAVTGRCTHRDPNIAQVPAVGSPYGEECRALFRAPPGLVMVGCDASGLELRMLAHYMARYDGGAYAKVLLEGDIHTANQKAAGLEERGQAKTFILKARMTWGKPLD